MYFILKLCVKNIIFFHCRFDTDIFEDLSLIFVYWKKRFSYLLEEIEGDTM